MRELALDHSVDFVSASSYGLGTVSSGNVQITKDLKFPIRGKHVLIVDDICDSGHTLAALKLGKAKGCLCLGVCNSVGSTIARESDAGVYLHAGPEIGVASTKAFSAQIIVLMMIALKLAKERGALDDG